IKCQTMTATVNYEGIAIVKGVSAREEGAGIWIECEFPMPVGTRVNVQLDDGGTRAARVVRVQEAQQGGGMALEWAGEATAAPARGGGPRPPPRRCRPKAVAVTGGGARDAARMKDLVAPPRLKEGDRVAVIAPAGPVPPDAFEAGVARLRQRYRVEYDEKVLS